MLCVANKQSDNDFGILFRSFDAFDDDYGQRNAAARAERGAGFRD